MMNKLEPLLALTDIPVNVAVLDSVGTIIGVNVPWRNFADANGSRMRHHGRGLRYLDHCGDDDTGAALRSDLVRLLNGEIDILTATYPCHSPDQVRWCLMIGLPLARSRAAGAMLMHADLTGLLPVLFSARELGSAAPVLSPRESILTAQSIADVVRQAVVDALAGVSSPAPAAVRAASRRPPAIEYRQVEWARLSARHRQIFAMLGDGKSNAEIAAALGISPNTVKVHVAEMLRRLGLQNRMQAALLASRTAGNPKGKRAPAAARPPGSKRPKPR